MDKSKIVKEIISNANINNMGIGTQEFYSVYNGYEFSLSKKDNLKDWYIQVNPEGLGFDYDGWWPDSDEKTIEEALLEAIDGAELFQDN